MKVKKKNLIFFTAGIILIVFLLMYYNQVRIFNSYHWGFTGKEYSFNLIPFKGISRIIYFQNIRLLQKIIFFAVLGFVQCFTICQIAKIKIKYFAISSIGTIILLELLTAFSSKMLVVIDMNNFIVYAIGFTIGYLIFYLVRWFYSHLNFRVKLAINRKVINND
jgi:hypothetical protein